MLIRRMGIAVLGLGLLGVLTLAAVPSRSAAAAVTTPTPGSVLRAVGEITALKGDGFTLAARNNQTYQVTVGTDTWIVVKKDNRPAPGTLADLQVGETVSVAGTANGTGSVAARVISQGNLRVTGGRPGRQPGRGHQGRPTAPAGPATIQSVTNGTLMLNAGNGWTRTVNTDAGTLVIRDGKLGAVSDLKAGDRVTILARPAQRPAGPRATRPMPTAAVIYVPTANDQFLLGVVKRVDGNTAVLRTGRGQRSVTLGGGTTYKALAVADQAPSTAAQSDVKAGTRVLVYSIKPAAGQTATASIVLILPGQGRANIVSLDF